MITLHQKLKYSICVSGATLLALAMAAPAQAVSFVSTFRPTAIGPVRPVTTEVGSVDAAGNYTTRFVSELQLTDIALSATDELFGITYNQLYRLPYSNTNTPAFNNQIIVGNVYDGNTAADQDRFALTGLGFDDRNNLYAIGGISSNGAVGSTNGFFQLNTTTGRATLISTLDGLTPSAFTLGGDAGDIVFNPDPVSASNPDGGRFFATTRNSNSVLFSIGLDGSTRVIGNTGKDKIAGLTFENGNLFGYTTDRSRVRLDLLTGAADPTIVSLQSSVLNPPFPGEALNIGGAASTATAVPEPSSAAGFVFLGVCFGVHKIMKRKQKLED
jgi:hypothetical protein